MKEMLGVFDDIYSIFLIANFQKIIKQLIQIKSNSKMRSRAG